MIPFAGQPLDRADRLRDDPAAMAELRREGLMLKLDGLTPELEDGALAWQPVAGGEGELVFLGLQGERGLFAAAPPEGNVEPAYAQREIWALLGLLSSEELAIYGTARAVLDWHARHRFCARCGHRTEAAKAGWQRNCPSCQAQHFPRVDPVAIMLVEHAGRVLLGRNARFPPGSYSALAGFIEPGESVEDGVAREVLEEAGVRVHSVRYVASQPWPFPSQLMLGCHALADDDAVTIDAAELEDARWFARAEVAAALAGDEASLKPPTERAIAHHLLRWWLEQTA